MKRYYYADSIDGFLDEDPDAVVGRLVSGHSFSLDPTQRDSWFRQIEILHEALVAFRRRGRVYFEYSIPRLGRRIDVLAILGPVIFVIEFKVGDKVYAAHAIDQVWDYALDLKNFHESSHAATIAPILVATEARSADMSIAQTAHGDGVLRPIRCNAATLGAAIGRVLASTQGPRIDARSWELGRYRPTPTIIEAATALYGGHGVAEISRSDAGATNLTTTSDAIEGIIQESRSRRRKSICFLTGVPGAGKTLVGLNMATRHFDQRSDLYSVFLSGNGPLVEVLREALARDQIRREAEAGRTKRKGEARSEVKVFVQNVHHFRDDCLANPNRPPVEHVAVFDEAQRAWNREQTAKFMRNKKKQGGFVMSEPEFLISCMDRHKDWAVILCLVGGGQEINTGEAGIGEWVDSLIRSYPNWHVHMSSRLTDSEYAAGESLRRVRSLPHATFQDELHLGVSMRSFRAERVSSLVKQLLDLDDSSAAQLLRGLSDRYPIVLTRDLRKAKDWLRQQARGSERYGLLVSSQAQRLKPHAIDVKSPISPTHWFLDGKEDVRSSFYLEDVATEFHVQGLELDWTCVTWDADFRFTGEGWDCWSFCGSRWTRVRQLQRQVYLKNAYRVLLTRARQGMVIVVPEGEASDPTRKAEFYDPTYEYLRGIGLQRL